MKRALEANEEEHKRAMDRLEQGHKVMQEQSKREKEEVPASKLEELSAPGFSLDELDEWRDAACFRYRDLIVVAALR